jgi:hypothetical protein
MSNQPSVEEQIKNKLTVILNDGDKAGLAAKINKLWQEL